MYHVLCGVNDSKEFPVSIFVEREGKDPIYICVRENTDEVLLKFEKSLHYKDYDEAVKEWPALKKLIKNAEKLDI